MNGSTEDRLRQAFAARAELVTPERVTASLQVGGTDAARRRRPVAIGIAAAVVLVMGGVVVTLQTRQDTVAVDPGDGATTGSTFETGPSEFGTGLVITDTEGTEHLADHAVARCLLLASGDDTPPRGGRQVLEVEVRDDAGSTRFTLRAPFDADAPPQRVALPLAADDTAEVEAVAGGRTATASVAGATGGIAVIGAGCSPAFAAIDMILTLPGVEGPEDDLTITGSVATESSDDGSRSSTPATSLAIEDGERTRRPTEVVAGCLDSALDPGTRILAVLVEDAEGQDQLTLTLPFPGQEGLPLRIELPWSPPSEETEIRAFAGDSSATAADPRARGSLALFDAGCDPGDVISLDVDLTLAGDRGPDDLVSVRGSIQALATDIAAMRGE